MLSLKSETPIEWVHRVQQNLDDILVDHAHCERKAAGVAMNIMFSYVENEPLSRQMVEIVNEELEHFNMVLDLLQRRGIPFRRLKPGPYGRELNDLVRKQEPGRAIDRLLVAALIEARSCERFSLLLDHLPDAELAEFYGSLFASEARHHSTYVQLAFDYAPVEDVKRRLDELATDEARIIANIAEPVRMHSS